MFSVTDESSADEYCSCLTEAFFQKESWAVCDGELQKHNCTVSHKAAQGREPTKSEMEARPPTESLSGDVWPTVLRGRATGLAFSQGSSAQHGQETSEGAGTKSNAGGSVLSFCNCVHGGATCRRRTAILSNMLVSINVQVLPTNRKPCGVRRFFVGSRLDGGVSLRKGTRVRRECREDSRVGVWLAGRHSETVCRAYRVPLKVSRAACLAALLGGLAQVDSQVFALEGLRPTSRAPADRSSGAAPLTATLLPLLALLLLARLEAAGAGRCAPCPIGRDAPPDPCLGPKPTPTTPRLLGTQDNNSI